MWVYEMQDNLRKIFKNLISLRQTYEMITFSNTAQIKYNFKKIDIFSFTRIFFCTDFANFKLTKYLQSTSEFWSSQAKTVFECLVFV